MGIISSIATRSYRVFLHILLSCCIIAIAVVYGIFFTFQTANHDVKIVLLVAATALALSATTIVLSLLPSTARTCRFLVVCELDKHKREGVVRLTLEEQLRTGYFCCQRSSWRS